MLGTAGYCGMAMAMQAYGEGIVIFRRNRHRGRKDVKIEPLVVAYIELD